MIDQDRSFAGRRARQTGNVGELEVMSEFQRLGWGTLENKRDDEGSDVFVLARSPDLISLRLVVGVQVKSGPSAFEAPAFEGDRLSGWWFAESDEIHFDDWININVPHLLVLHDLDERTSYWVHVTQDAVRPTGQGRKILVPATQRIDDANREALEEVARTGRRVVSWEGSVWDKPTVDDPKDALRYALLTPRLISPHPNANPLPDTSAPAAVAMLCEARFLELHRGGLMRPKLGAEYGSWSWRFFIALRTALFDSTIEPLMETAAGSGRGNVASTAAAVAAGWLTAEGRPDESIELLRLALKRSRHTQVDRAWLNLQLARALVETGRIVEARRIALKVRDARDRYPTDATASALGAAASILLFNTAPPGELELSQVIIAADTAPMWWLTQMEYSGLAAGAKKAFENWTRNETVTIGGGEPEVNKLVAGANISSWTGDQSSWTQATAFVGKALLTQSKDVDPDDDLLAGMRALVSSGDDRAVLEATRAIVQNGPASLIRQLAAEADLRKATKTTAPAMLSLLEAGGDVLDRVTANRSIDWLVQTVRAPELFVKRTTPTYLIGLKILEVIVAVIPAASLSKRRKVARYLSDLEPAEILPIEIPTLARLCSKLHLEDWSVRTRHRLLERAGQFDEPLRSSIVASTADAADSEMRLRRAVSEGNLAALHALTDVRLLSSVEARVMIRRHAEAVRQRVREARQGSLSFGGSDPAADLALLNTWHQGDADWPPLTAFLRSHAIPAQTKQPTLWSLARLFDLLPEKVQGELISIATRLVAAPPDAAGSPFESAREAWGVSGLLLAKARMALQTVDALMGKLMRSSVSDRQWSARIAGALGRDSDVGLVVAMTSDPDPRVRAVAAEQLARFAVTDQSVPAVREALVWTIRDAGMLVPRFLAAALAGSTQDPDLNVSAPVITALDALSKSISADAHGYAAAALATTSRS